MKAADLKVGEWVYVADDPNTERHATLVMVTINMVQVLAVEDTHFTALHRYWCNPRTSNRDYYFVDYNCAPHRNPTGSKHNVFVTLEGAIKFYEGYLKQHPFMMIRVVTEQPEDEWFINYQNGVEVKRIKRVE